MKPLPTLRRAQESDIDFAYQALERTMKAYAVATWGAWQESEERAMMAADVAAGRSPIIELDGVAAGLLRVDRLPTHLQLEQLYIVPERQRQGIGAQVLASVLAQARGAGLPVRLRVLRVNPAQAFYRRHGFLVVSETPERCFMEHAA